jgi:hypothetical protein
MYYTQIGTAPEHICRAGVDLSEPQGHWQAGSAELVLKPELNWEGAFAADDISRGSSEGA